jgi:hypothetical protein
MDKNMYNWRQDKQGKTKGNYTKDKKAEAVEVNLGRDDEKAHKHNDGAEVNTERACETPASEPSRAEAI